MGILDAFWMASIVAGAAHLFYRSFWKQRGRCHGCADAGCPRRAPGVPSEAVRSTTRRGA